MTQRHGMTKLGTARGAGRAGRENAGRPAPGWPAVIVRAARSGLLISTAAIHLDLCSESGLDPDQWFPVSADPGWARQEAAAAIAICTTCPVRGHCLRYPCAAGTSASTVSEAAWSPPTKRDCAAEHTRIAAGRMSGRWPC